MWTMKNDERLSKAIEYKEAGRPSEAVEFVLAVIKENPGEEKFHWFLGHLYWELGKLDEAIESFRMAVRLAPAMERDSKGLFHCLWEVGKEFEALEEAKRFLAIADSEDYRDIIQEINARAETGKEKGSSE